MQGQFVHVMASHVALRSAGCADTLRSLYLWLISLFPSLQEYIGSLWGGDHYPIKLLVIQMAHQEVPASKEA